MIETHPEQFYCPVTYGFLIEPHRTSCCKKNLSWKAVARLKRDSKPCPLCRDSRWETTLNKEFQNEVLSQQVFCPNVDKECEWQGELRSINDHLKSCLMDHDTSERIRYVAIDNNTFNYRDGLCRTSPKTAKFLHAVLKGDYESVKNMLPVNNINDCTTIVRHLNYIVTFTLSEILVHL